MSAFVVRLLVLGLVSVVKRQAAIENVTAMLIVKMFEVLVEGWVLKSRGEKQVSKDHRRDRLGVVAFLWLSASRLLASLVVSAVIVNLQIHLAQCVLYRSCIDHPSAR